MFFKALSGEMDLYKKSIFLLRRWHGSMFTFTVQYWKVPINNFFSLWLFLVFYDFVCVCGGGHLLDLTGFCRHLNKHGRLIHMWYVINLDPVIFQDTQNSFLECWIKWPSDPSWSSILWDCGMEEWTNCRLKIFFSPRCVAGILQISVAYFTIEDGPIQPYPSHRAIRDRSQQM